jgi:hypothetical protein
MFDSSPVVAVSGKYSLAVDVKNIYCGDNKFVNFCSELTSDKTFETEGKFVSPWVK